MENNEVGNITSLNELYALMLKREDRIYDAINGLNKKIDEVKEELKQTKEELRTEFRKALEETKEELRAEIEKAKEELRTELKTALKETKEDILNQVSDFFVEDVVSDVVHKSEFRKLEKDVIMLKKIVLPGYAVNEEGKEYNYEEQEEDE